MPVNFNALMNPAVVGGAFQKGYDEGEERAATQEKRRALSTLAADPTNAEAMAALMRSSPEMGLKFQQNRRQESEFQEKRDFNKAVGEYVTGPDARLMAGMPNALAPSQPSVAGIGMAAAPGTRDVSATVGQQPQAGLGPDLSPLGRPESRADAAFLRMVRSDPVKAMQIKSKLRDNFVDQLESERSTYDWAVSRFAGINDDAGYQAARAELAERLGPAGSGILEQIPPAFPGAEALEKLRLRAIDAKDQLSHFQQQANINADNARADRNTESLISDRSARRNEMQRNNTMRNATTRRGQDIRGSGGGGKIKTVKTREEAMALPSGTRFRTPDGQVKVRP